MPSIRFRLSCLFEPLLLLGGHEYRSAILRLIQPSADHPLCVFWSDAPALGHQTFDHHIAQTPLDLGYRLNFVVEQKRHRQSPSDLF